MTSPWSKPKPELSGQLPHAPACPKCGATIDGFTSRSGAIPKPNDVAFCFYCGSILRFTDELKLREPDEIDAVLLPADPTIKQMLRVWEMMHAARSSP